MNGYIKNTPSGPVPCLYLDQRGETYVRETSLPLDWTKVRIGIAFSLVGSSGADSPAANEMIVAQTLNDDFSFGIGNGMAALGLLTNRFVGLRTKCWQVGCSLNANTTQILTRPQSNATDIAMCIGNGNSIWNSSPISGSELAKATHQTAPNDTAFAVFSALQLTLTPKGLSASIATRSNVGKVDEIALRQFLLEIDGNNPSTVAGGWWLNGEAIGLRHFMIRAPFAANRLRLHAVEVIQLA